MPEHIVSIHKKGDECANYAQHVSLEMVPKASQLITSSDKSVEEAVMMAFPKFMAQFSAINNELNGCNEHVCELKKKVCRLK